MEYIECFVPKEEMDRFPLDRKYIKHGLFFRKHVRIVHYTNDELPTIWFQRYFKLNWPWRIKESNFEPYYPKLYFFFTKILGIKKPYQEYKGNMTKEEFEKKFSIDLDYKNSYCLPC